MKRSSKCLLGLLLVTMLSACHVPHQMVRPEAPQARVNTQLFFYPTKGQTQAQQDRDQYDCYVWAMKKSGFDPSSPQLAPHQRYTIVSHMDPNHDASAGMTAGAIIGSVVAPRSRSSEGALVGAMIGAIVGSASDAQRNQQMAMAQQEHDAKVSALDQKAEDYMRAMTACLQGRDYIVK